MYGLQYMLKSCIKSAQEWQQTTKGEILWKGLCHIKKNLVDWQWVPSWDECSVTEGVSSDDAGCFLAFHWKKKDDNIRKSIDQDDKHIRQTDLRKWMHTTSWAMPIVETEKPKNWPLRLLGLDAPAPPLPRDNWRISIFDENKVNDVYSNSSKGKLTSDFECIGSVRESDNDDKNLRRRLRQESHEEG